MFEIEGKSRVRRLPRWRLAAELAICLGAAAQLIRLFS